MGSVSELGVHGARQVDEDALGPLEELWRRVGLDAGKEADADGDVRASLV